MCGISTFVDVTSCSLLLGTLWYCTLRYITSVVFLSLQTAPVDPERFQKAYSEWSYMEFEARRVVGYQDFQCDACGPVPMCVHVDGNAKLYRFKSAGTSAEWTETRPYHESTCIASKEDVDKHVERLASVGKVRKLISVLRRNHTTKTHVPDGLRNVSDFHRYVKDIYRSIPPQCLIMPHAGYALSLAT